MNEIPEDHYRLQPGVVLGGGIAGLAFALAAQSKGMSLRIYEAASDLREAGAGILLSPNAMQALAELGLRDEIIGLGAIVDQGALTDAQLRPLSQDFFAYYSDRVGQPFVGIHRARLLAALARRVEGCETHSPYAAIDTAADGVQIHMSDGRIVKSAWAVLADGIHSVGRKRLFPETAVRDCGEWCWRGIAKGVNAQAVISGFREAWGGDWRFGMIPIAADEVYWYALRRDRARPVFDLMAEPERQKTQLLEQSEAFHPLFREAIAATPAELILKNRILDLPPLAQWHRGAAICIGDAAHATTPNMGQGAGQAIEDAVALAACMQACDSLESAFRAFTRHRKRRADRVIRESYRLGRFAGWRSPFAELRNSLMRRMPQSMAIRQMRWLYEPQELELPRAARDERRKR